MKYGYNRYYELLERTYSGGDLIGSLGAEVLRFWNCYHRYMKRKTRSSGDLAALHVLREMIDEMEAHALASKQRN